MPGEEEEDQLVIEIAAHFFNDPPPPNGRLGGAYFHLWDFEIVELLFLNDKDQYLELQFGPYGQHLMLLLNGKRKVIRLKQIYNQSLCM